MTVAAGVLHRLRVRGPLPTVALAQALDCTEDAVAAALGELEAHGLVAPRGQPPRWASTDAGRSAHRDAMVAELARCAEPEAIRAGYERFVRVNPELLATATAWQVRTRPDGMESLNDHTDARYDRAVIEQLGAVHRDVAPVIDALAVVLDRFAPYGRRLQRAYDKVRRGDRQWFTSPTCDSYHTVWFELHEDLLVTLGLERRST